MTIATPRSVGTFCRSLIYASSPPAEPPTQTTGKTFASLACFIDRPRLDVVVEGCDLRDARSFCPTCLMPATARTRTGNYSTYRARYEGGSDGIRLCARQEWPERYTPFGDAAFEPRRLPIACRRACASPRVVRETR